MKPRMFTAFVLVASLALLLAVSTSAQRSDRPIAPPSPGDLGPQSVNAPAISLGQPGTSFRYVQTFGVTETPYISDTAHLNFPMGIATDGTNVLIGEYWGHRVLKYTSTGTFVSSLGRAGIAYSDGDIWGAFDMAVDSGGNTWVADSNHNRVSKFDASGAYLGSFKEGTFGRPAGIAFDGSGNVYVSEGSAVGNIYWQDGMGHQRIQIYDSAGNYLSTIGITDTSGSDNNHFYGPQHITVYSNTLYVADKANHRIQIFDISTPVSPVYSATIGVAGASGNDNAHLDNPIGVAVDSNYIYVADSGNNRVQVFSRTTRAYVATIGTGYGTGNDQFNRV